jgi:hypothetical protein
LGDLQQYHQQRDEFSCRMKQCAVFTVRCLHVLCHACTAFSRAAHQRSVSWAIECQSSPTRRLCTRSLTTEMQEAPMLYSTAVAALTVAWARPAAAPFCHLSPEDSLFY